MTFKGAIRVEDEQGRELTRRTFFGQKDCKKLLTRYCETFKKGLEEQRLFIVVEQDIKEEKYD